MIKHLLFLALFFQASVGFAQQCQQSFKYHVKNLATLKYSSHLVQDAYDALRFPMLRYAAARPIHSSEVEAIVNEFYRYRMDTETFIQTLSTKEARGFKEALVTYDNVLKDFVENYHPLDLTSKTLFHLQMMSNIFKGRAFEALVELLLVRLGYEILLTEVNSLSLLERLPNRLRPANARYLSKKEKQALPPSKLDFVVEKDGQVYVFEIKSIRPGSEGLSQTLKALKKQLVKQDQAMRTLGLRDHVIFALIPHFEIPNINEMLGSNPVVDHVIPLRKDY